MSVSELACTYATLILYDDGIPVTVEKISTLMQAAKVDVESYWSSLFAKLVEKRNIDDLIVNVGAGGGAVVSVTTSAGGAASADVAAALAVEEKKDEPKEESDKDMGFSIFN